MTIKDTNWQPIKNITADGHGRPQGIVNPVKGVEQKPCFMCRSWDKDEKRLVEHLLAAGLVPDKDGCFVTPIAKDLPGRVSLRLNPKHNGFCRLQGQVTEDLASCEHWQQVRFASELATRVRR